MVVSETVYSLSLCTRRNSIL